MFTEKEGQGLDATLLATKLHRPAVPVQWVSRPWLSERLEEGLALNRRVTLVSAPAGFGKTTCVSAWLEARGDLPAAWLSLDPADDDPGRFLLYVIASLQKVYSRLGRDLAAVLRAGELPSPELASAALVNDIASMDGRFLLVLDDFHVLQDPAVLQFMERLVAHCPPALHLVLIAREDPSLPLARLRANNQLTEIRAGDLRFTGPDTARFLTQVMGLALPAADIAILEQKTEGWAAGLQLAGLSLRASDDPATLIASLSGSHRAILSYLTEQVLSRQPPDIRRFLLQTAILDELAGDLCDAVTGRDDSGALLEHLYSANLFLIALDNNRQWYRYHHLFADLLRDLSGTNKREETAALHRRASSWYAGAGRPAEAIEHALAGAAYTFAGDLLEAHAMDLIMQGHARRMNGWVQALPSGRSAPSPRTHLAFAWMHLLRGAYAQAEPFLAQVKRALAEPGEGDPLRPENGSLLAEWLVMQALMRYSEGKSEASLETAAQALAEAPEEDSRVRSLAHYALASAQQALGAYAESATQYRTSIAAARQAHNVVAEVLSAVGLAVMAYEHGQLHLAQEIADPVARRMDQARALPPISAIIYGVLADVHYQWDEITAAERYLQRTQKLATVGGYRSGAIYCRVMRSRLLLRVGESAPAAREVAAAVELAAGPTPDYVRQELAAQRVVVALARRRPGAAQRALREHGFAFQKHFTFPELPQNGLLSHAQGLLYNSSLRLVLHQARLSGERASLRRASELAGDLVDAALRGERLVAALEALLLSAQLAAEFGDGDASRADYLHALELAEPEGFLAVFLEQGQPVATALATLAQQKQLPKAQRAAVMRILAAFGQTLGEQPEAVNPEVALLPEPLTERELQVLRMMAGSLKYREIAAELFISLNTVRYHVKGIYGKLGVNSRLQAVEAARRAGIL